VKTHQTIHRVNPRASRLSRCKSAVLGAAAAAASVLGVSTARPALAANVLLQNGNSSVTINPNSSAGVEDWTINSQNQINQEWFWFSVGNQTGQSPLQSLGTPKVHKMDTTGDGENDTVELVYPTDDGIQITVTYSLTGGQAGSDSSDLTDSISINNETGKSEKVNFFQYANFNLGDSTTGQTVNISDKDTATVTGNGYQAQTVVSPMAQEYEANTFPNLLNTISSSSVSAALNDQKNASGDPEWGFEWCTTLPMCSGSYVITGDQDITGSAVSVPEPVGGTIAMLGIGGMFLSRPRRRDEDADHRDMVQVGGA